MSYCIKRIARAISQWKHYKYQDWEFDIYTSSEIGYVRYCGVVIMTINSQTHQVTEAVYPNNYSLEVGKLFILVSPDMEQAAISSFTYKRDGVWSDKVHHPVKCQEFIKQHDLFPAHLLAAKA
jgi:hypothetical protein